MRKAILFFLSLTMLLSVSACSNIESSENKSSEEIVQTAEPIRLVNKMTETERSMVNKHALTLLDEPVDTEHKVSIGYVTKTPEELLADLENMRDEISDDEYEQSIERIDHMAESGEFETYIYALIDGFYYSDLIWFPEFDDKGMLYGDETNGHETITFDTFDDYLDWVTKDYKKNGFSDDMIKSKIRQIQMVRDVLKSGDYETLPEGSIDPNDPSMYDDPYADPFADYRNVWEYDRESVEAIKDSIDEINIYDEELKTEFLVHVTLPPDYDKDKAYPVFLLTDGVWRFGTAQGHGGRRSCGCYTCKSWL